MAQLDQKSAFAFPQNFSPQMSGGYDDKSSPAMAVPGPMVGETHTHTPTQSHLHVNHVIDLVPLSLTGPNGTPWTHWTCWFYCKYISSTFLSLSYIL